MLKVGIEHEDADVSEYALSGAIVNESRAFEHDDKFHLCKSLEHYPKRCYVEGLEIRTLPHASVGELIEWFRVTYAEVVRLTDRSGFSLVLTSNHPFKTSIALDNRLDAIESKVRAASAALGSESGPLELLDSMLTENDSYAMRMKRRFAETGSIIECISGQYEY